MPARIRTIRKGFENFNRKTAEIIIAIPSRTIDVLNMSLISGVESACFDLISKHFGSTIYNLFGGPVRNKIKVYANGWYTNINNIEYCGKEARKVINKGYRALKFDPFGSGSGFLEYDEFKKSMEIIQIVHALLEITLKC